MTCIASIPNSGEVLPPAALYLNDDRFSNVSILCLICGKSEFIGNFKFPFGGESFLAALDLLVPCFYI